MSVTRGFFRKRPEGSSGRLPPGQYDTGSSWPVLTAEATPRVDLDSWTLTVDGLVEQPTTWSWDEIHAAARSTYAGDIHCVTTWSKLDVTFTGVCVDAADAAGPKAGRAASSWRTPSPATRRTSRWPTSPTARPGWSGSTAASRCPPSTVARSGCWCRTCTSGSRPSGSPGSSCSPRTSRDSGSATATTTAATRGWSSATRVTVTQPEQREAAIEDVTPVETTWAADRIITEEQPDPGHGAAADARRRPATTTARAALPDPAEGARDYTAQRSYSVASDDDDPLVEFLVERLPGGEVSEFLADVAEVGDVLEVRGPIGRWFVWDTRTPALCLVGGIGVVPAVAMLRTARRVGSPTTSPWPRSGEPRAAALPRGAAARRGRGGLHPPR